MRGGDADRGDGADGRNIDRPALDALAPRLSPARWGARATIAVAVLGLLFWSWGESKIDPVRLVENRGRAIEYLFGQDLSDAQEAQARREAERVVQLRVLSDAERTVRDRLGLGPTDAAPEPLDAAVAAEAAAARAAMSPSAYEERVEREYDRITGEMRGGYFPPETDREKVLGYWDALLETVAIAVWGTLLSVAAAVPAALFGAERSVRLFMPGSGALSRSARWLTIFVTRRTFDFCRGFNEFVLALIFVAMIGLGPFPGVLALAVHTFGVLGKVFSEAIDTARPGEIEGVVATGASAPQVISYAIMPQIMPYVVAQSLLRFESNVRSASVIGLVGAGGIGFLIDAKLKAYEYREVATMLLLIIVVVSVIDYLCGRVMRRFV